MTAGRRRTVANKRATGQTFASIGDALGVSRQRAHQILHGNRKRKQRGDPGRCGICEARYSDWFYNIAAFMRENPDAAPTEAAAHAIFLSENGYVNCPVEGCDKAIKPAPRSAAEALTQEGGNGFSR